MKENHKSPDNNENKLLCDKIRNMFDECLYKIRLLEVFPRLLADNAAILKQHLTEAEANYIFVVYKTGSVLCKELIEFDVELFVIYNTLERINILEKDFANLKKYKMLEKFDKHVAYAVNVIFSSASLKLCMEEMLKAESNSSLENFFKIFMQLRTLIENKFQMTAEEEMQREETLKATHSASLVLTQTLEDLEKQLDYQRNEFGQEVTVKEAIYEDYAEKIEVLEEKANFEIEQYILQSETKMMKDYNISKERQDTLEVQAKRAIQRYESLLESNLRDEKLVRAKRIKIEAQLANCIAMYDADMGEKQAELDELEKTLEKEGKKLEALQELFDEQEVEYLILMKEKEEEQRLINEEKAWLFLQNRSARRIQRYWRGYRARRLARKKGRKGKKKEKGGSAGSKKGKKKPKKPELKTTLRDGPDPNALLESTFKPEIMEDIQPEKLFEIKEVPVDLNK